MGDVCIQSTKIGALRKRELPSTQLFINPPRSISFARCCQLTARLQVTTRYKLGLIASMVVRLIVLLLVVAKRQKVVHDGRDRIVEFDAVLKENQRQSD